MDELTDLGGVVYWCKVSTKHNKKKYRIGLGGVHTDRQFLIVVRASFAQRIILYLTPAIYIFSASV